MLRMKRERKIQTEIYFVKYIQMQSIYDREFVFLFRYTTINFNCRNSSRKMNETNSQF